MSLTRGRVMQLENLVTLATHASYRPPRATSHALVAQVADAALRAKQILADAEACAAERLSQFEERIEAIRADMLRQAHADAELSLAAKVLEIGALRQRSVERAKDDIISMAQALAERIIGEELTLKPERLLKLAQQCIHEARGSRHMVLYAHPGDAAQLSQQVKHLEVDPTIDIRIVPEPRLSPGDLRVETDIGTVDARIGTQLANLATKIRESLRP